MINPTETLNSPFEYERHNKTFIYYCETVIYPDGKIEYAVPSHQEKVIEVYSKKKNQSIEQTKKEFWNDIDFLEKMVKDTGLVLTHYDLIQYITITPEQDESIKRLIEYNCVDKNIKFMKINIWR